MELNKIYDLMRVNNQRITKQKELILNVFKKNEDKMISVKQIKDSLPKEEKINETTIYRNVISFSKLGILESIIGRDGVTKYMVHDHDEVHHHLICTKCFKAIPIPCGTIKTCNIANNYGFKEDYHVLEIYGICNECQSDIDER